MTAHTSALNGATLGIGNSGARIHIELRANPVARTTRPVGIYTREEAIAIARELLRLAAHPNRTD